MSILRLSETFYSDAAMTLLCRRGNGRAGYIICQGIGLEAGSAAQDYIQLHDGDAKVLAESLEYIQHTASRLRIRATRLERDSKCSLKRNSNLVYNHIAP